uniref:Uncharacterized protein n=1 Tax=Arundo donax TaxID=35708 RepID=A0A0A9BEA5_ARUDO
MKWISHIILPYLIVNVNNLRVYTFTRAIGIQYNQQ